MEVVVEDFSLQLHFRLLLAALQSEVVGEGQLLPLRHECDTRELSEVLSCGVGERVNCLTRILIGFLAVTDLIKDAGGLKGCLRRLKIVCTEVIRVDVERLSEVHQGLAVVAHADLQLAQVGMHLCRHDVARAEDA